jgi:anti-sigma B factor antagonist
MECKDKIVGDIAILYLEGKMIGTPDTDKLHCEVQCLLKEDIHKIVVDLHGISWMGSMGVGALMRDLISVRNAGGDLRLAHLSSKLKSLFKITKLASVILIYETVDQAVKSFELN